MYKKRYLSTKLSSRSDVASRTFCHSPCCDVLIASDPGDQISRPADQMKETKSLKNPNAFF